ncbi:MAG TPA: protein phosphatase 2C domain-containing protein [Terracidiphilus sp.]|nr:protein phosphatase 2C domain-containing protein [Terracidiphilus sp.]
MLDVEAAVVTHMGRVRTHNEDAIAFVRPSREAVLASHGVLALVADGMGGHNAGERASALAAETIARAYFDSSAPPRQALLDAIQCANQVIHRAARADRACRGMGTTCVVAAVSDDRAYWAWVGDSRLYLIRSGGVYRLTEDHTVVQDMVRLGWMTREDASLHRDRNVLERALGTRDSVEAGASESGMKLQDGDRLLLSSDGLHDLVSDIDIGGLAGAGALSVCAQALLDAALERGAPDNVSVLLIEATSRPAQRVPGPTREHVLA